MSILSNTNIWGYVLRKPPYIGVYLSLLSIFSMFDKPVAPGCTRHDEGEATHPAVIFYSQKHSKLLLELELIRRDNKFRQPGYSVHRRG